MMRVSKLTSRVSSMVAAWDSVSQSDWLPMISPTRGATSCCSRSISPVCCSGPRGKARSVSFDGMDMVGGLRQAMLSGISRLSSQAISSLSISLRFFRRCICN